MTAARRFDDLTDTLQDVFMMPAAERVSTAIKNDLYTRLLYQPAAERDLLLADIAQTQRMKFVDAKQEFAAFEQAARAKQAANALEPMPAMKVVAKQPTQPAASSGMIDPLQTETVADLMQREIAPTKFTVARLLAEGLAIFAGPPKDGKSLLCLHLAIAVASGGDFLGEFECRPGRVLYAGLEDGDARLQARFRSMLDGVDRSRLNLIDKTLEMRRSTEGGIEQVEQWLVEHAADARLVMIDTLARIRRAPGRNSNSYLEDSEFMAPLQALALAHHVTIMLVHHTRKQQANDPLDMISGTTGLVGVADQAWLLRRESRGQADAVLEVTGRDIESQEIAMTLNDKLQWTFKGNARDLQKSSERQDVVNYLSEHAGAIFSSRQIAEALGKKQPAVCNLLNKLHQDGIVLSGGFGKHYIPKERV